GIALSLNNIGVVYGRLGDNKKALDHLEKSLELRKKLEVQKDVASSLNNIGDVYMKLGKFEKSLELYQQSLEISKGTGDKSQIAGTMKNIGDAYLNLGRLDLADKNLNDALRLTQEVEDQGNRVLTMVSLSALNRKRGHFSEAEKLSMEALKMASALPGKERVRQVLQELVAAQEGAGNYAEALATHKKFKEVNDSIYTDERARRLALLESSYELEKREADIEKLKRDQAVQNLHFQRERSQRNALLGILIFLGIVGFLIHRKRIEAARITDRLSLTDPLTGLRNRRFVEHTIDYDLATSIRKYQDALREGTAPYKADHIFLVIDLDDFDLIKKQYGRTASDDVIRQIAEILPKGCRTTDTIVRWDKEEFIIIARFTTRNFAGIIAERFRSMIESADLKIGDETIRLTCSIGFAAFPFVPSKPDAFTWEQMIAFANGSLLAAKRSRNAWIGLHTTEKTSFKDVADGTYRNLRSWIDQGELSVVSSLPVSSIQW
ncbi:MAG TPA: tetratricopeptide repeat-containing diguanylate cyclase, partial [Acidobacteriota bacterium]|nr:tetratricopeptide repeat-containing diguanylate cyclase [Acidobacteriota bacterium]